MDSEKKEDAGAAGRCDSALSRDAAALKADYCRELRRWMWQCYCGYGSWQSGMMMMATPPLSPASPPQQQNQAHSLPTPADLSAWYIQLSGPPQPPLPAPSAAPSPAQSTNTAPPAGREYTIPSPLHRFLAEMVDFFILFCVKATIVLWIMHLSGVKDISKIVMQFVVEEIDENTSLEDLQKMMVVALIYRVLVCFYEIICIWGAGGATPGKFLLGLRVVSCDSTVMVRPNRVLVVPASNVNLSASAVRALNKNLSIAFLFPVFIPLLFFQHNRTVYDIVAGTIVVRRQGAR